MGYHDNRIFKINKELLKPCDSIKVKVVRRLIEKKDVRITEKSFCKKRVYNCALSFCSPPDAFAKFQVSRYSLLVLPECHLSAHSHVVKLMSDKLDDTKNAVQNTNRNNI